MDANVMRSQLRYRPNFFCDDWETTQAALLLYQIFRKCKEGF